MTTESASPLLGPLPALRSCWGACFRMMQQAAAGTVTICQPTASGPGRHHHRWCDSCPVQPAPNAFSDVQAAAGALQPCVPSRSDTGRHCLCCWCCSSSGAAASQAGSTVTQVAAADAPSQPVDRSCLRPILPPWSDSGASPALQLNSTSERVQRQQRQYCPHGDNDQNRASIHCCWGPQPGTASEASTLG
jgi:hypothetical protein